MNKVTTNLATAYNVVNVDRYFNIVKVHAQPLCGNQVKCKARVLAIPRTIPSGANSIHLNRLCLVCTEVLYNGDNPLQVRFSLHGGVNLNSFKFDRNALAQTKFGIVNAFEAGVVLFKFC